MQDIDDSLLWEMDIDELIDERDRVTRELEHPDYDADSIVRIMDYLVVINEIIRIKETAWRQHEISSRYLGAHPRCIPVYRLVVSRDTCIRSVSMRVVARKYGFQATIKETSDSRYQLSIFIGSVPHMMVEVYDSFEQANTELHRTLGLIIREKNNAKRL